MPPVRRLRSVDLFCGAGGLSEGLRSAGYDTVLAVDRDPDSCATFAANHPRADVRCASVADLDPVALADAAGAVDLVVGGPACQPFSTARVRGRSVDETAEQAVLWRHMLAVVAAARPAAFLLENVPGMLGWNRGAVVAGVTTAFESLGYAVSRSVVLAADHGVPQLRRRLFLVGVRGGPPFVFPSPTHLGGWRRDTRDLWEAERVRLGLLPHTTAWDALADLPRIGAGPGAQGLPYGHPPASDLARHLREGAGDLVGDHITTPLSPAALAIARHVPPGGTWRDVPADLLPARFARIRRTDSTTVYGRIDPDRPAWTVNTQFRNTTAGCYTHPVEDRAITPREAARLQTFPDSYRFDGPPSSVARQIGNAVPPLLGAVLGAGLADRTAAASQPRLW